MKYLSAEFSSKPVKAVLFDFDGTISTLRCGWEKVMKPLMLDWISGFGTYDESLEKEVDDYIDDSTGIQTIQQMKWLAERVHLNGANPDAPTDPWFYKKEYNDRLMNMIGANVEALEIKKKDPGEYLISGSVEFLEALKDHGVTVYVASGTDHKDVMREAAALGVIQYFDYIAGAPEGVEDCSKEKVITDLLKDKHLTGNDFAVIGDGKVEIRLGKQAGARTVGLATDEVNRKGINRIKERRLTLAGADAIAGDFEQKRDLLAFLGLE